LKEKDAPAYAVSQEKLGGWLADGAKLVPQGTDRANDFTVIGPDGKPKLASVLFVPKVAKGDAGGAALTVPVNEIRARLDKQPAEVRSKVGLIASALGAMTQYEQAYESGQRPEHITSKTPILGKAISDTDLSRNQRLLNEAVGRLQSGGVIGNEELVTFNDMGPRPGDTEEQRVKKLADQRQFLEDRLIAFGFMPEELDQVGFKAERLGYDEKGKSRRSSFQSKGSAGGELIQDAQAGAPGKTSFTNEDLDALNWAKANLNDPRAGAIMQRLKGKGLR
jgi:hypothetical protein